MSAKGTVGKTITIKGTGLLGPARTSIPRGLHLARRLDAHRAGRRRRGDGHSIVVDVISGTGTGPMVLTWNNGTAADPLLEVAATAGSITINQPKPAKKLGVDVPPRPRRVDPPAAAVGDDEPPAPARPWDAPVP